MNFTFRSFRFGSILFLLSYVIVNDFFMIPAVIDLKDLLCAPRIKIRLHKTKTSSHSIDPTETLNSMPSNITFYKFIWKFFADFLFLLFCIFNLYRFAIFIPFFVQLLILVSGEKCLKMFLSSGFSQKNLGILIRINFFIHKI